jgi:hypothetical protein
MRAKCECAHESQLYVNVVHAHVCVVCVCVCVCVSVAPYDALVDESWITARSTAWEASDCGAGWLRQP